MDTLTLVIIVIVGLLFARFVRQRLALGRSSTWFLELVAQHPDEAYGWFQKEDCWTVSRSKTLDDMVEHRDVVGPFPLTALRTGGQTVYVYGHLDDHGGHSLIEKSQQGFRESLGT